MSPNKALLLLAAITPLSIFSGWALFNYERTSSPEPVITGNVIDTRTAMQRLESATLGDEYGAMLMNVQTLRTSDGFHLCYITLTLATGKGESARHQDFRSSNTSTCEAAATEVLAALEARNVR